MNKTAITVILVAVVIILSVFALYPEEKNAGNLDDFAKCLAGKGATMYGAEWCSHCQNEKKACGDSFRLVPYVECPDDPKRCIDSGIDGYPTWIFPDSKKLVGEQGLKKLSSESGCPLPL